MRLTYLLSSANNDLGFFNADGCQFCFIVAVKNTSTNSNPNTVRKLGCRSWYIVLTAVLRDDTGWHVTELSIATELGDLARRAIRRRCDGYNILVDTRADRVY